MAKNVSRNMMNTPKKAYFKSHLPPAQQENQTMFKILHGKCIIVARHGSDRQINKLQFNRQTIDVHPEPFKQQLQELIRRAGVK